VFYSERMKLLLPAIGACCAVTLAYMVVLGPKATAGPRALTNQEMASVVGDACNQCKMAGTCFRPNKGSYNGKACCRNCDGEGATTTEWLFCCYSSDEKKKCQTTVDQPCKKFDSFYTLTYEEFDDCESPCTGEESVNEKKKCTTRLGAAGDACSK
jgi:hypothetical protein